MSVTVTMTEAPLVQALVRSSCSPKPSLVTVGLHATSKQRPQLRAQFRAEWQEGSAAAQAKRQQNAAISALDDRMAPQDTTLLCRCVAVARLPQTI